MANALDSTPLHHTIDCPHRAACGACSWLRDTYGEQLERKRQRLKAALSQQIRLTPQQLLPTVPSPQVEGYRNRAKMTISSGRDRRWSLGYFKRQTREVVDAQDCRVLVPELLETTQQLRKVFNSGLRIPFPLRHIDLRCGSDPLEQHLTLVVKADDMPALPIDAIADACAHVVGIAVNLNPKATAQVIKGRVEPVWGEREVYVDCAGLWLRVSPGSFFQVNLGLLPEIHEQMAAFLGEGGLLLDLYAGVGTHGLALRGNFSRVLCVEGVRSSVADAKASIKSARLNNVEVMSSPVRRAIRRIRSEKPSAVVLNPSAAGADPQSLEAIAASSARRLAYLSCDPDTLARDLEALLKGGFRLASVRAIDMMPQTKQVEALALLSR